MDSEKFCLKWNEFEENIRHSFQGLRHQQKLFDVFSKCTQTNMLVYLKGVLKSELENIIDFLYNGETFVTQEALNSFLVTAQELKVKGLQTVVDETNTIESKQNIEQPELKNQSLMSSKETESYLSPQQSKVFSNNEIILDYDEEDSNIDNKNIDLDEKLERMIEKSQGIWKCKVCNKIANQRNVIKNHAETHLQGIQHSCDICMKTYPTRVGVKTH